jgi:hypothetical protein
MSNRERIVIYGAITLLLVINLAALTGSPGRRAAADPGDAGEGLGPAERLTLVNDGDPLVVRCEGGRLAWSESPHDRAYSIGFVHVGKALGPLLEAEHFVEEFTQLEEEIRRVDDEITERLAAFRRENQDVGRDDPKAAELQRVFQELLQERERWRMEGTQRLGLLRADQIERAYRDFVAAVEVVAERKRIDIVMRFIPTGNEFQAANPAQAYTGITSRIALKYPDGLDITDAILDELALEVE